VKLSIIPRYNECPYLEKVLQRVVKALPQAEKKIIYHCFDVLNQQ
jgi:glycosyltransferase involved in cell wall biosynthesis